jgi:hypothetical protein
VSTKIGRFPRRAEHIDRQVSNSHPCFVMNPAFDSRSHVTRDAGHLFVGRSGPTLVGGRNRVAPCAKLGMIGERNRDSTERERSGHHNPEDREARLPDHAPIEHVEEIAS